MNFFMIQVHIVADNTDTDNETHQMLQLYPFRY